MATGFLIHEFSSNEQFSRNKLHLYTEQCLYFKHNIDHIAVVATSLTQVGIGWISHPMVSLSIF